jgi:hypothetical protein
MAMTRRPCRRTELGRKTFSSRSERRWCMVRRTGDWTSGSWTSGSLVTKEIVDRWPRESVGHSSARVVREASRVGWVLSLLRRCVALLRNGDWSGSGQSLPEV